MYHVSQLIQTYYCCTCDHYVDEAEEGEETVCKECSTVADCDLEELEEFDGNY